MSLSLGLGFWSFCEEKLEEYWQRLESKKLLWYIRKKFWEPAVTCVVVQKIEKHAYGIGDFPTEISKQDIQSANLILSVMHCKV